jgi:hypothetical protein
MQEDPAPGAAIDVFLVGAVMIEVMLLVVAPGLSQQSAVVAVLADQVEGERLAARVLSR